MSFLGGSWGMNRSAEQTNHPRTALRFTRFVCPALRFIPHEPTKKDTHSLNKVKTTYNCQPERLTSQSKRLTATELSALELTAPSWSLKGFNVTNDTKGFILHRYLQSGDIIGFGIYRFYRRNKKVIKCVIRATFILSAPEQEQLPSGNSSCFGADKMTVALIPI